MSGEDRISDELLTAFADGELDAAEWDRVAARLSVDSGLRARLCELRATKELVRGAYADVAMPAARTRHGVRWAGIAALCLASVAAGWFGRTVLVPESRQAERADAGVSLKAAAGDRVVFHVSASGRETLAAALDEVEDALRAAKREGRALSIEIVANSAGLDLLRAGVSPFPERVARLRAAYPALTLVACNQTLDRLREKGLAVQLLPGVVVAPSALDQVVKRLQVGWTYVRA